MKKIKRTITIRKVELVSYQDSKLEVCPFCHSPMPPKLSPKDSTIELPAVESKNEADEWENKNGENLITKVVKI